MGAGGRAGRAHRWQGRATTCWPCRGAGGCSIELVNSSIPRGVLSRSSALGGVMGRKVRAKDFDDNLLTLRTQNLGRPGSSTRCMAVLRRPKMQDCHLAAQVVNIQAPRTNSWSPSPLRCFSTPPFVSHHSSYSESDHCSPC